MENLTTHKEKDLKIIAYLLASGEVRFSHTEIEGGTVYAHFTPEERCLELIDGYYRNEASTVSVKKLLGSLDDARTLIFRAKDESKSRSNYGSFYK